MAVPVARVFRDIGEILLDLVGALAVIGVQESPAQRGVFLFCQVLPHVAGDLIGPQVSKLGIAVDLGPHALRVITHHVVFAEGAQVLPQHAEVREHAQRLVEIRGVIPYI